MTSSHAQLIVSCLELVADRSDDLAPEVYRRFFAQFPEAEDLFGIDTADFVKGGMIVSLLQELMGYAEGAIYKENIRRWISDHKAYGVTLPMYQVMFDCLLATIQDVIGEQWTEPMEAAWRAQYGLLVGYIEYIYNPAGKEQRQLQA
jgi:hemoglobin-like flavoprotein